MLIRIKNINVVFDDDTALTIIAARALKLQTCLISHVTVIRKAVDARRYNNAPIYYVYTLDITINSKLSSNILRSLAKKKNIEIIKDSIKPITDIPAVKTPVRPVIAGFGPAGIFCALTLCRYGYKPIILERGNDVDTRHQDVKNFWQTGQLNPASNVQFGEGGAGTFSDGKLTTRVHDPKMQEILTDFVKAGAPAEIKYLHKPHIGTDILHTVVKNLRKKILAAGGEIHFASQLTDITIENNSIKNITLADHTIIDCQALFLAIGHSARDTYEMLYKKNIQMQAKPFAIGVRIEHPQNLIDSTQYGVDAGNPLLPTADYNLTFQDRQHNLSCYSFCMCPGGKVVAAASEENQITTNGMSYYKRNSGIANSALLTPVGPAEFGSNVLDGIKFQRHYEHLAFKLAGSNYFAPVQTVGDYLSHQSGNDNFLTAPTYAPGIKPVDLHDCLPASAAIALEAALSHFDKKLPGFAHKNAVMTGLEMRSSAPCRILRDKETFMSLNTSGLYPVGEGAGYAGGIMSAAVDGVNAALSYIFSNK